MVFEKRGSQRYFREWQNVRITVLCLEKCLNAPTFGIEIGFGNKGGAKKLISTYVSHLAFYTLLPKTEQ